MKYIIKTRTMRAIKNKLHEKYNKSKEKNPLKNDAIEQEKERINLQNEVDRLEFKTPFGDIDKSHFDEKFDLNDKTNGYLKEKLEYYKILKHHSFINNIHNKNYLNSQPELAKLFDDYKNSEDAMSFVKINEEKLSKAFEVAELFKPTIDTANHSSSLEGIHTNLSHQPKNTSLKPKVSEYIRWGYDPEFDNKKSSSKGYQLWVDKDTPIIVDGKGEVDKGD